MRKDEKETTIKLNEKERFQIFVNKNGGLSNIYEKTGISIQRMSNYLRGDSKSLSTDVVAAISKHYPNFNIKWWLNGDGEYLMMSEEKMLKALIGNDPEILQDLEEVSGKLSNVMKKIRAFSDNVSES